MDEDMKPCPKCKMKLPLRAMPRHLQSCSRARKPTAETKGPCEICGKLITLSNLLRHERNCALNTPVENEPDPDYSNCPKCNKTILRRNIPRHLQTSCKVKTTYCGQLKSTTNLSKHKKICLKKQGLLSKSIECPMKKQGLSSNTIECPDCKKTMQAGSIYKHRNHCKGKVKMKKCEKRSNSEKKNRIVDDNVASTSIRAKVDVNESMESSISSPISAQTCAMLDVIYLSSDDEEEEVVFNEVCSGEEEPPDVKPEAIHTVFLVENTEGLAAEEEDPLAAVDGTVEAKGGDAEAKVVGILECSPDEQSPASEIIEHLKFGSAAKHLTPEFSVDVESEESSLQNGVAAGLENEEALCSSKEESVCKNDQPAVLEKSLKIKRLLAEQLAKVLKSNCVSSQDGSKHIQDEDGSSEYIDNGYKMVNMKKNVVEVKRKKIGKLTRGKGGRSCKKVNHIETDVDNNCPMFSDDTNDSYQQMDSNTSGSDCERLLLRVNEQQNETYNQEESQNRFEHTEREAPNTATETIETCSNNQPKKGAKRGWPRGRKRKKSMPDDTFSNTDLYQSRILFERKNLMKTQIDKQTLNLTSSSSVTPRSSVEDIILQVSQGYFSETDYTNENLGKKYANRTKRATSLDDSTTPTKKFKESEVGSESGKSFSENHNSVLNLNSVANKQLTVENSIGKVVSNFIEQTLSEYEDVPAKNVSRYSKKSMILDKYNLSPSRRNSSSFQPQPLMSTMPTVTERRVFEKTLTKRDQNNQSPNNQESFNRLKFTFDRSSGKEQVSVSIVSPSQLSPGTEVINLMPVEGTYQSTSLQVRGLTDQESNSRTDHEKVNEERNHKSTSTKDEETTDVFQQKSHFIDSCKLVFDNNGESLSNEMGGLLLIILKSQLARDFYHELDTQYASEQEVLNNFYDAVKPTFHDLFQQLCTTIFSVPHKEQYKWLFLAWFAKMFLYVNNECEDFADKIHEIKLIVINILPNMFKLHQISILQFFQVSDDEFELNIYRVIVLMQECVGSEDHNLLNHIKQEIPEATGAEIKEEIPDVPASTDDSCTAGPVDSDQNITSEVPKRAQTSSDNTSLDTEKNELSSSIHALNPDDKVSTLESCTANSIIKDSQSNINLPSQNSQIVLKEFNKPRENCENELNSLIKKLNNANCLHVSVIKKTNTVAHSQTEEINNQPKTKVNQQLQRVDCSDLSANNSTGLLTACPQHIHKEHDNRSPIKVKSPWMINCNLSESHKSSALPTFNESFTHPKSSEVPKVKDTHLNPRKNNQSTILQEQTPNNTQVNSYPLISKALNSHRTVVEIPSASNMKSGNDTQQMYPFQWPKWQTNCDPNYPNKGPNVSYSKQENSSPTSPTPFIGGKPDYPTINQGYSNNHQVQYPVPGSHTKEIEARIHGWVSQSNIQQNNQSQLIHPSQCYYQTEISQSGVNPNYGQSSQPSLTSQQANWLRKQYLAIEFQKRYNLYHQRMNAQGQPKAHESQIGAHATIPSAATGVPSMAPNKHPPPYQFSQQPNTTNKNQYYNQSTRTLSQNSNPPTMPNWQLANPQPSSASRSPLLVPNKTVMDIPVDSNVTINNFNVTAYIPSPPHYNNVHVPGRNNQQQKTPPS